MRPLTVSEILTFQKCPSLWAYKYYAMRVPTRQASSALDRGLALHSVLERVTREAQAPADADGWESLLISDYRRSIYARGAEPDDKHEAELQTLSFGLQEYWRYMPLGEIVATEKTLVASHNGTEVAGRLDALVRRPEAEGRGLWHRQYKTFSRLRRADGHLTEAASNYILVVQRSLHEVLYRALIETHWPGERYRGTELVLFGLDSVHARAGGAHCSHCGRAGYTWRGPQILTERLRIRDVVVDRRLRDLRQVASGIGDATTALLAAGWPECGGPPPLEQREHTCFDRGRLCPMLAICNSDEGASILDNTLFTPRDPLEAYGYDLDLLDEGNGEP